MSPQNTDGRPDGPPREEAALDELERVRAEIEQHRRRRKVIADEFDQFVRSFKNAPEAVSTPVPTAFVRGRHVDEPPPGGGAQPHSPPAADAPRVQRSDERAQRTAAEPIPARFDTPEPETSSTARRLPLYLVALAILIAAAVLFARMLARPEPDPSSGPGAPAVAGTAPAPTSTSPAATGTPPPAPGAAAPPPASGIPAGTAAAGASGVAPAAQQAGSVEITTTRGVWLRVVADGERVVERELPANSRIPVRPAKSIVIRTGDAGAVRVAIGGKDQGPLGRDGEVVTRSFSLGGR